MTETDLRDAVVADTHAVVWFLEEDRQLSAGAAQQLDACDEHGVIYVCYYTLVEVRYLVEKGKPSLDQEAGLFAAVDDPDTAIEAVPVDVGVIRRLLAVPRTMLKDPADRLIVATAIELGLPLVTRDSGIKESQLVECIW
jgi:PIN domain nuclease of toxin-antitoxin system